MAHSSLQVCMDSSDWLHQGTMTMSEELSTGLDSSSPSPSGGGGTTTECMLAAACSSRAGPPLMERRLRPPHDQHLKCPRCDSTHTKFCYYNNYSLSQPRYFCKTCRRYWTKGGTLRNIPVGGGCRKNKKPTSSKKSKNNTTTSSSGGGDPHNHHINHQSPIMMMPNHLGSPSTTSNNHHPIDLHLSFPHEVQCPPHLAHLIGAQMSLGGVIGGGAGGGGGSFMGLEGGGLIRPIDFMESKYEGFMGGGGGGIQVSRGHDFIMGSNNGNGNNYNNNGNDQFGLMGEIIEGGCYNNGTTSIIGGINYSSNSLFGVATNNATTTSNDISFMDQRLLLPYDHLNNHHHHHHHQSGVVDVKPNPKMLSLEWQDQGCTTTTTTTTTTTPTPTTNTTISDHHNSGSNALNSWTGFLGSFQSPTTNPLV